MHMLLGLNLITMLMFFFLVWQLHVVLREDQPQHGSSYNRPISGDLRWGISDVVCSIDNPSSVSDCQCEPVWDEAQWYNWRISDSFQQALWKERSFEAHAWCCLPASLRKEIRILGTERGWRKTTCYTACSIPSRHIRVLQKTQLRRRTAGACISAKIAQVWL